MATKDNLKIGQKYVSKPISDRMIPPERRVIYISDLVYLRGEFKYVTCLYKNRDDNHVSVNVDVQLFCLYYDLIEEPEIIPVQGIKVFDMYHAITDDGRISWERVKSW